MTMAVSIQQKQISGKRYTSKRTVIDDYGSFDTAEANFGKTLHFKKGTNYRFIVKEDAFMTRPGVNANLSNKEICIDFTGGE